MPAELAWAVVGAAGSYITARLDPDFTAGMRILEANAVASLADVVASKRAAGRPSAHTGVVIATTRDGVELWWEMHGEGPAVLLVPGRGDPSDLFPWEFTKRLEAGGLSSIRWDPRDTGLSGEGGSSYTVATLADDAAAVLDAARVQTAHVVGISMAGLVMARLATRHVGRVSSLTFVSAMSPDPDAGMGEDFFSALDMDDRVAALVRAMGETTTSDRSWAIDHIGRGDRRAPYRPEAVARHQEAAFRLDWPTLEALQRISAPALIFHGNLDRVLPLAHAGHSLRESTDRRWLCFGGWATSRGRRTGTRSPIASLPS